MIRPIIQTVERTASTSLKSYLQSAFMMPIPRVHWGKHHGPGRSRGDKFDIEEELVTHVITIVRDPLDRLVSQLSYKAQEPDYNACDDFFDMLQETWKTDIYAEPFVDPFTAVGGILILKFDFLKDAVAGLMKYFGKTPTIRLPHENASDRLPPSLPQAKIEAMYDGEYAKHFNYLPIRRKGTRWKIGDLPHTYLTKRDAYKAYRRDVWREYRNR